MATSRSTMPDLTTTKRPSRKPHARVGSPSPANRATAPSWPHWCAYHPTDIPRAGYGKSASTTKIGRTRDSQPKCSSIKGTPGERNTLKRGPESSALGPGKGIHPERSITRLTTQKIQLGKTSRRNGEDNSYAKGRALRCTEDRGRYPPNVRKSEEQSFGEARPSEEWGSYQSRLEEFYQD